MLAPAWEDHAAAAANAESVGELSEVLNRVIQQEAVRPCEKAAVVLAGDTRESTPALMQAAREGVQLTGAEVMDIGICTTPMLHYQVVRTNDSKLDEYYHRLLNGFKRLTTGTWQQHPRTFKLICCNPCRLIAVSYTHLTLPTKA